MNPRVSLEELIGALEWASAGEAALLDCEAYVCRASGSVHWRGEGVDKEAPEDIEDGSLYVAVPHRSDLELGRTLAVRFAEERAPFEREAVVGMFRKRGAYSSFKSLLARIGRLDEWHRYEQDALESALRQWCVENGFVVVP